MKKILISCMGLLLILMIVGWIKDFNTYTVEKATDNGDFITYPEQINIDRFNEFIANVNNQVDSKLRITEYSKEGVPKVNDLTYSDNVILLNSFYPDKIFNKGKKSGEYTEIYYNSIGAGDYNDMYLINPKEGTKTYVCQIRNLE